MLIDNKVDVNRVINIKSLQDLIQEKEKIYKEEINNDPEIEKLMIIEDEFEQAKLDAIQKQQKQLSEMSDESQEEEQDDEIISDQESLDDQEKNVFYSRKREKVKQESQQDKINQRARLIQQKLKQKIEQDLDILTRQKKNFFSISLKNKAQFFEFRTIFFQFS